MNYSEGCDSGDGLCENLCRYSKVPVAKRKEFKRREDSVNKNSVSSGDGDDMSIDSDAGAGLASIIAKARAGSKSSSGRKRKIEWKTE